MSENIKTILACDDEPHLLELMDYIIGKAGFKAITTDNGIDAIQAAHDNMPDLILLDVNMPGMTGIEVCKQLKTDDKTKNIRILVLTANVQASHKEEIFEAGADYFFPKPFSPRELKEKLHELLD